MDARLYPYLSYRDAPKALDWLRAVGFEIIRRQDGPAETVLHAEVRMGEAVLMVASNDADYQRPALIGRSTGQGLYLFFEDVEAFHRRALAAGGTSVIEPGDTVGYATEPGPRSSGSGMDRRHVPARSRLVNQLLLQAHRAAQVCICPGSCPPIR